MYLIFDTETTGLPKNYNAPISDSENWPRAVQIAWQLHDEMGQLIEHQDYLIQPDGFNIPYDSERVHGISTELAQQQGITIREVLQKFQDALSKTTYIVGQNVGFDINIMGAEFYRYKIETNLAEFPVLDTCTEITAELCQIPGGRGGRFKLPTLTELHEFLFKIPFAEAHNATADVEATSRCFFELIRIGEGFSEEQISKEYIDRFRIANPETIQLIGLKHINLKKASEEIREKLQKSNILNEISDQQIQENLSLLADAPFVHLHNHTQFSVLQATASIAELVKATAQQKMPAVAITDIGNMMGTFHFIKEIATYNKGVKIRNQEAIEKGDESQELSIKPIVGCEFFVCQNHLDKTQKDNGYQIVMIAKNKKGYHNLAKMASIAYTEGFYYVPRIDRKIVEKYKDDLIILSGNLFGEIPSKILYVGEKQAEESLLWWKELFGEDFYLEIMRHGQEDEDRVNSVLLNFSKKHNIKLVATNNTYYINPEDANAHDILLCVKEGEKQTTEIGRGRGYRYGLPNQEYYFKSAQAMKNLFKDIPETILSIKEIIEKIEPYELAREVLLPKFDIPEEFQVEDDETGKKGENKYLKHLTYLGAEKKYKSITDQIKERLDFELSIIEKTGYPGYFLIVQDFIAAARSMGVSVGPGRGSAAGSAVAYCLGITNIDPIKYDLLFERFLNPDRVSMPDIDIDFDDEGRGRVMEYVIDKYGANQVAQIITYGTMAAKSSIRDTARVLDLPLSDADKIAKLVPTITDKKLNTLNKLIAADEQLLREKLRSEDVEKTHQLKQLSQGNDLLGETIQQAKLLEGSIRNTGIHACGVIITPDDITNFVPVSIAKDSDLWVTQFDNSVVESAGLLKMDFLGLKTLTLIKDTVKLVKETRNIDLNPDDFPIDDEKTYQLFQRGETVGIFQYESAGMQKYMKELKPTVFADLIAMNALYRPGPLEYIPSFIRRKHGLEPISYDLDDMEEYLKETYGITVYQEQVMLLSQKLAGFSKGEADMLRKAMGKKQKDVLDKMRPKFIEQASEKGYDTEKLAKIWQDWEAFASYAFNKSHSTCYAWVAYQTAYLKANYPAEYMAAVLSNNMNDIKSVRFFLEECHRMGIKVLGPDVNESNYKFAVNKDGAIRFGMGAIKGVGKTAVDTIVENRENGHYKSIFDMAKRVDLRAANKKAFENIALAGGFDSLGAAHRAQYFYTEVGEQSSLLEKAIRYGSKAQESANSLQMSLFGETNEIEIPEPTMPTCNEWGTLEKLRREKEVVGMYISGHPLDDFKHEIKNFCNSESYNPSELENLVGKEIKMAGMVTQVEHKTAMDGRKWAIFSIEDYDNIHEFRIFKDDYLKYHIYLVTNQFIYFKIKIEEGFFDKKTNQRGKPRVVFTQMYSLQDVLTKNAKKVDIWLDLKDISIENIAQLKYITEKYAGNIPLNFLIYEPQSTSVNVVDTEIEENSEENLEMAEIAPSQEGIRREDMKISLEMYSRKTKIQLNKDFLNELEYNKYYFKLS